MLHCLSAVPHCSVDSTAANLLCMGQRMAFLVLNAHAMTQPISSWSRSNEAPSYKIDPIVAERFLIRNGLRQGRGFHAEAKCYGRLAEGAFHFCYGLVFETSSMLFDVAICLLFLGGDLQIPARCVPLE